MSRFKSFYGYDGSSTYLDLSEIVSVSGPFKNYPEKKWYSEGIICYRVRYVLKSGNVGSINCWCENLAINYMTIIKREA